MENFHSDILENILSRLPIKEALYAKRVCTTWRAILRKKTERSGVLFSYPDVRNSSDDDMYRRQLFYEDEYDHYDHANINYYCSDKTLSEVENGRLIASCYPKDIMVGSCNGLVCFGKDYKVTCGMIPYLICNPLTGESVLLPDYDYSEYVRGCVSSGFGYCPSTNKYKVVTIHFNQLMNREGRIQVYTVGECKWRYVGFISPFKRYVFNYSSGVYANGVLYWLHDGNCDRFQVKKQSQIVAFHLEGEKFSYIALPSSNRPHKLLGGNNNLYLVYRDDLISYTDDAYFCTDIWVYRKNNITSGTNYAMKLRKRKEPYDNNSLSSWIKEFSMRLEDPYFKPFAITRNNEVLLWYEQHHKPFGIRLCCYDPNTSTLNELWDDKADGAKCDYIQAIPHVQSVVCLKDLGETNVTSLKDLQKLILQANIFKGMGKIIPLRRTGRLRGSKRLENC